MNRWGATALAVALAAVATAPAAVAQQGLPAPEAAPEPTPTAPALSAPAPTARIETDSVRLVGGRLVRHLRLTIPGAPDGTATVTWQAYGGSRSATRLPRLGHGRVTVPVSDGQLTFRKRVRVGDGFDRSGGFCEQIDLTGLGAVMPATTTCPDASTATRGQLPSRVPEFSMYSDSAGAGLLMSAGATTRAAGDMSAVFDLKVCRRLTYLPCPPNPVSALSAIRSQPGSVGDIAVIDVGYNDWAQVYGIEPVVSALRARGVKRIVWMTLREHQSSYASINAMIRAAAKRHPFIQVADWNAASSGLGGFAADGVHLSSGSAVNALADFVRAAVQKAAVITHKS
jgi:hypothetical protein